MPQPHAEFSLGGDISDYEKAMRRVPKVAEQAAKAASATWESEMEKVFQAAMAPKYQQSAKAYHRDRISMMRAGAMQDTTGGWGRQRGSAFGGGQNAGYRVGMVAQQAQDIAVQLQMGARMSTIIAQQGSQIASFFGPQGMVIGGVLAIGAALVGWALGTEKAAKKAKEFKEEMEAAEAAFMKFRTESSAGIFGSRVSAGMMRAEAGWRMGGASEETVQELKLWSEYYQKRSDMEAKFEAELRDTKGTDSKFVLNRQREVLDALYKETQAQDALNKAKAFQAGMAKEAQDFDKREKKAAEIQEGIERRAREWDAEEYDRLHKRIKDREDSEKRVAEIQKSVGRDLEEDENKRLRKRMDKAKEQIEQGAELYEKMKETTFGKSQAQIRREVRQRAKAEAAEMKWAAKTAKEGGLVDIRRDMNGRVMSGIDPITGKRISGKEARQRAAAAAVAAAAKDKKDGVKITDDSIKALVGAIEKLLTK